MSLLRLTKRYVYIRIDLMKRRVPVSSVVVGQDTEYLTVREEPLRRNLGCRMYQYFGDKCKGTFRSRYRNSPLNVKSTPGAGGPKSFLIDHRMLE